jgi:putative flavoprotein involved in K+ transport
MPDLPSNEHVDTVVIGAGQAGLATGHHLRRAEVPFVVLERSGRVGDVWRDRFDSLRLYSPAKYDGLPGMPFPADPWTWPGKDEVGDYLEAYARQQQIPVRCGVSVQRLRTREGGFDLETDQGGYRARNVVVAAGTFAAPRVPDLARDLDPEIRQLHSADYGNPSDLQDGPVLVVGASHSGADIAYEAAKEHRTILCGPHRGEVPLSIDGPRARFVWPIVRVVHMHLLTERTPIGRRMRPHIRTQGGPLLRVKRSDLAAGGVERIEARVTGTASGRPVLADGRVLDVANVVWCTGFGADLSWLDVSVAGSDGWPETDRGVVPSCPGLYFRGRPVPLRLRVDAPDRGGSRRRYVVRHLRRRTTASSRAEDAVAA